MALSNYLPATAMLGAAVEALWHECSLAVANRLGSVSCQQVLVSEPGFAKLVTETRKLLEGKAAKPLLMAANQSIHSLTSAEVWTTALRERRNALHWGKAKSFVADHAETDTLLMAAPPHFGTLG